MSTILQCKLRFKLDAVNYFSEEFFTLEAAQTAAKYLVAHLDVTVEIVDNSGRVIDKITA